MEALSLAKGMQVWGTKAEAADAMTRVPRLLSALVSLPGDSAVQAAGIKALAMLGYSSKDKGFQLQITESGALPVILQAMDLHVSNADVQFWCCYALWSLVNGNSPKPDPGVKAAMKGWYREFEPRLARAKRVHAGAMVEKKSLTEFADKALTQLAKC